MRHFFLSLLCILLCAGRGWAHDGRTSLEQAELNDYLMALQVLRHSESRADALFHRWKDLRKSSWKIRELTDEQDLSIDDPAVVRQIEATRRIREELLRDSRTFFSEQTAVLPTVHVRLEDEIHVVWDGPTVTAPVGSRRVVLVEITSDRSEHSHLYLTGAPNDHILFWSQPVTVFKDQPRYTFVYVAPAHAGPTQSSVIVHGEDDGTATSFTIRADGTLPSTYDWYNPLPDEPVVSASTGGDAHSSGGKRDGFIRFRVRDYETGEPIAVRVDVRDADGNAYWTPLRGPSFTVARGVKLWQTPLWTFQPGPFFYIGGDAELGVDPAGKTVGIYRGFEYEPVVMDVPEDGVVDVTLRRWMDMPMRGWYSGHTHIHTTDVGLPVQFSRFWPLVTQGEDLGVSAILTLKGEWDSHAIYADEYPMGLRAGHSTPEHFITYGEEYRNNPYGHLALLGLDYLIQPISSGALGEMGGPDYPPNAFVLDEAIAQGAVTIGAHFGYSILRDEPIKSSWPSTGFEMPVDVALGKIHLAEIYGAGGQQDVWYMLLNCGFNLPATAGPDWVMKDTPRAYVYLGDESFTLENWQEGLRSGKSFISKGPMLFFTVEGKRPGAQLHYPDLPQTVAVTASALTPEGPQPVEIVLNGEVVARGTNLSQSIRLEDSAWIAARTNGAHSNPVYVTLEGRPRGSAAEARQFIETIHRLEEWVRTKGLFDEPGQKETVLNLLNEGRTVYEGIIERAQRLGRATR